MNRTEQLNNEISKYTLEISNWYPEWSRLLDETPCSCTTGNVSVADLEDYLQSLKVQLRHFKQELGDSKQS